MHSFEDFRAIVTTDEPLAPHTWFRLGGPAAYLARPRDTAEVVGLIRGVGLPAERIPARGTKSTSSCSTWPAPRFLVW